MLGNCIIRYPVDVDGILDKGVICESLLFFGKAHVVLDLGTLGIMVKGNFVDELIEMLKAGYISANHSPQAPVLFTDNKFGLREHFFTVVKIGGHHTKPKMRNVELLEERLVQLSDDKTKAKKQFRQLADLITYKDVPDNGVPELGRIDVSDPNVAREVARMALMNKGVPEDAIKFTKLEIMPLAENRFAIITDINFEALRKYVADAEKTTFSQNDLFPSIAEARFDIGVALTHNAALVGNQRNQAIVDLILRRSLGTLFDAEKAKRDIYDFISVATPSVREVINAGERTPQDFFKLMDKAAAFQEWLQVQNPTADLVKEMLKEKAKTSWLESLPTKAARFALFTIGADLVDYAAPGSGPLVSAIDSFLIDQIAKRWRPHFFIENHLKGFLDTKR